MFHAHPLFVVADDLYEAQVLDVAPLEETGYSFVDDGDSVDGSYLVGLGQGFEVLVVRVVDGAPAEYAVLESDVDWADYDDGYGDVPFGAGFTYRNPANTEARVFFVANEGFGVEVALPLTVSDDCWNSGSQTSYHEICVDRTTVSWRASSVETAYNDGFKCPENTQSYLFTTAEPTYAPTAGPSGAPSGAPAPLPTPEPCLADACWDDASTGLFDCEDGGATLVARREYDATIQEYKPYALAALDVSAGAYDDVSELAAGPSAAALFDGGDLRRRRSARPRRRSPSSTTSTRPTGPSSASTIGGPRSASASSARRRSSRATRRTSSGPCPTRAGPCSACSTR